MVLSASTAHAKVMRDGRKLLNEANIINMLMYCTSFSLVESIDRHFPGFSALLNIKLRPLGLDPHTSLITKPTTLAEVLKQFFGGVDLALHHLKRVLSEGEIYSKVITTILRGSSDDNIKEELELIVFKYRKDLEKACRTIKL